jgi:hypothetical protein
VRANCYAITNWAIGTGKCDDKAGAPEGLTVQVRNAEIRDQGAASRLQHARDLATGSILIFARRNLVEAEVREDDVCTGIGETKFLRSLIYEITAIRCGLAYEISHRPVARVAA